MKVHICLALIFFMGLVAAYEEEWAKHIEKHKLNFKNDTEHHHRKKHFKKTHDMIEAHNKKNKTRFRLGHNHFSHMTDDEKQMHLGLQMDPSFFYAAVPTISPLAENRQSLPINVDWSKDSCMQPVKNQGYCGSCWIFSATAVLEFASCSRTQIPVSLSEEQIVDCIGYDGCKGGMPFNAWLYVATVGGQNTGASYPYVRGVRYSNWTACKYDPSQAVATISTSNPFVALPLYDVPARMAAIANRQLLSVTLNCPDKFFNLVDGIFNGPCSTAQNHAVNLVGYGTSVEHNMDYWVVRNSWGSWWGQNGFMKIQRGVNMCGIEQYAWTAISNTGDVPLGVPHEFSWTTSSDGLYKYSNCSYSGPSLTTLSSGNCGLLCAQTNNCDMFSAWKDQCTLISKNDPQNIRLATGSINCGQVISRPTFNFASGSNGLAMYSTKCSYTSINRQILPSQLSDEADCGAVCAVSSNCSYFAFVSGNCNMYAVANQSFPLVPSTQPSTYFSSCGYVTSLNPFVPNWQSGLNGQIMFAQNCGFIGIDPVDIANQSKNAQSLAEADCRSACASSTTCTNFRWSNGKCKLLSLVSPVVYYSVSGSCGYIVKPNTSG